MVTAKITKWKFDDVLREGNTADGKQVLFKFRTHGEFQISVTADKPDTPYKMVVWVGPDIKPKSKPLFVPKSEFKGGGRHCPSGCGGPEAAPPSSSSGC